MYRSSIKTAKTTESQPTIKFDFDKIGSNIHAKIHSKYKTNMGIESIKENYEVICLLRCKGILVKRTKALMEWEIVEIKYYPTKTKLEGYSLREEGEDPDQDNESDYY